MARVEPAKTDAVAVRARLVDALRRDLIGPGPQDEDLARELLPLSPSRWYLTGFFAPAIDPNAESEEVADEGDPVFGDDDAADPQTGRARAADDGPDDEGAARRIRVPSSLGLTVLVEAGTTHVEVEVSWGDYAPVPPLPPEVFTDEAAQYDPQYGDRQWRRLPRREILRLRVPDGRGARLLVPDSAGAVRPAGGLAVEAHARPATVRRPDGTEAQVKALTVMLVNRRAAERRRFADVTYAFQLRLAVRVAEGLHPRRDMSGLGSADPDAALADLHHRDVAEYAVGRNTSAGWDADQDGTVRAAFTDPMPQALVERVEPNEAIGGVVFGMQALAEAAAAGPDALGTALDRLPALYEVWIAEQGVGIGTIVGAPRQDTARRLLASARVARDRIAAGIALLRGDPHARLAFRAMNEAVARANRQRTAGRGGDPTSVTAPRWRPFQLAFILLNLPGLVDGLHPDREAVDLLFFPTGGGKTEAYLGLAGFTIAHRRITRPGTLGAGVAVLMRYTLRLLTLDQLGRAAGVVCALELMRGESAWQAGGKPLLGTWPIEIGLWVGSAASPNRLGGRGNTHPDTAVARVRRYQRDKREAPAPIKVCPWCAEPFTPQSFACVPNAQAPRNMEIRCASAACAFTGDRALPVLTVDEAIYRRLPAFMIATVDKFAGLPWLAEAGAFFGHVDREDEWGFYGAADPKGQGRRAWHAGDTLLPPTLVIQDELHLISGPLGTVAALYETALDRLATRTVMDKPVRPKIVASTATVRRASAQIEALFDRDRTAIFPPPGPDRLDSFFARTVPPDERPARLYVGFAAPGKGPKLVFLSALRTVLAAAEKEAAAGGADPYMTALCYFNALRELGGARRIVEDEVRAKLATYGAERRRVEPPDAPFADRRLREVLEITSRESTDQVAAAKDRLAVAAGGKDAVDVALATNMISVGLDIGRLGLMLVQGQPKAAAEYIQATSRVGREADKPGLVLTLLNVHKPRDRLHYEGFRNFHICFYRAVEATSVTPWAARALDRALAAVVVAAARHLRTELTREDDAGDIDDLGLVREEVVRMMLDRAPPEAVVGGHAALRLAVEGLFDTWAAIAAAQTESGERFYYGYPRGKALLHDPLDPVLAAIDPRFRAFTAGRSMRDVEHVSILKITDPHGQALTG